LRVAKQVHGNIAARSQSDQLEDFLRAIVQRLELADALPEGISIALRPHRRRKNVLVDGLAAEKVGDLETAAEAALVYLLRAAIIDAAAIEPYFTGTDGQPSRDQVKQG